MTRITGPRGRVDHIAIAVRDLEQAIVLYEKVFGFVLTNRREVQGKFSGMLSAEAPGRMAGYAAAPNTMVAMPPQSSAS